MNAIADRLDSWSGKIVRRNAFNADLAELVTNPKVHRNVKTAWRSLL